MDQAKSLQHCQDPLMTVKTAALWSWFLGKRMASTASVIGSPCVWCNHQEKREKIKIKINKERTETGQRDPTDKAEGSHQLMVLCLWFLENVLLARETAEEKERNVIPVKGTPAAGTDGRKRSHSFSLKDLAFLTTLLLLLLSFQFWNKSALSWNAWKNSLQNPS